MKPDARLKHAVDLLWISVMFLASCGGPGPTRLVSTHDENRLYWCIGLIESGKVRRGMDTNELQRIFGKWLVFTSENEAMSLLPAQRLDDRQIMQSPTPWHIKFALSYEGIVTNYWLSKDSGK
jgi:hypothetical protein